MAHRRFERIVSVSGGKDSTAVYLLMMERGKEFRAVFADVENEADETYEYVRTLPDRTGGPPIQWVKAELESKFPTRRANIRKDWPKDGIPQKTVDEVIELMHPTGNVFLDACLLRGGFPSHYKRFCTDTLKIIPIQDQVIRPAWEGGRFPVSVLGIRFDESRARELAEPIETKRLPRGGEVILYRPILEWTIDDVMAMHARFGITPNPLYAQGFDRVGCMPCIYSRKRDVRLMGANHPEAVERIRRFEALMFKARKTTDPSVSAGTFFSAKNLPGAVAPYSPQKHGVDAVITWAGTSRGGRQYPLDLGDDEMGDVQKSWNTTCHAHGLCE